MKQLKRGHLLHANDRKWIGHAAKIAEKHYSTVRDEYFDVAATGAAQSGAVALQKPVQQAAARSGLKSQESTEVEMESNFVLVDAEARETLQNTGMPLVGVEPRDVSIRPAKTLRHSSKVRAAKSDALDPNLQELIVAWPQLSEAVRGAVLVMVRAAVSK